MKKINQNRFFLEDKIICNSKREYKAYVKYFLKKMTYGQRNNAKTYEILFFNKKKDKMLAFFMR